MRHIVIIFLFFIIYSLSADTKSISSCNNKQNEFVKTCENMNAIACQSVPIADRKNCLPQKEFTSEGAFDFFAHCGKGTISSVRSFWNLIKGAYEEVAGLITSEEKREGFANSTGEIKSALTLMLRELITHPIAFAQSLKNKLLTAIGNEWDGFQCLNTRAKSEKACEVLADIVIPPAAFGKFLFKGGKGALKLSKIGIKPIPKELENVLIREKKFSSITPNASPKAYETKPISVTYTHKDPSNSVKYLTQEERRSYELIFKPEGSPNAKLYHTPEAQTRLFNEQKEALLLNSGVVKKSPALNELKEKFDHEAKLLHDKFSVEFDQRYKTTIERIKHDPNASMNDKMFLSNLEIEKMEYTYTHVEKEMRKLQQEASRKIDKISNDPVIAHELDNIKKTLAGPVSTKTNKAIYVMSPDGKLFLNEKPVVNEFHHSSFLAGKEVSAAGEMGIKDGVPTKININSGHYKPENSFLDQVATRMRRAGVDLDQTQLDYRQELGLSFNPPPESVAKPDLKASTKIDENLLRDLVGF